MPGDETGNQTLQQLLKIHEMVTTDEGIGLAFDKGVLEELIEANLKFQAKQDADKAAAPKTGRRAAIEAQKARKRAAEV